jgi:hypothetical protein
MKKLLSLSALLITLTLTAQSWTFSKGGNAFDGTYKTSSVVGKGTEYPYKTPSIVINKFDNDKDKINFYLNGAGYHQDDTGLSIKWVFDNEPQTIYSSYSWSLSEDGKIIFFYSFNNPNEKSTKLEKIDIIDKLTKANKVSIRVNDNYGSNDLVFSLSGSTKAINYVIPPNEREKLLIAASEKRKQVIEDKKNKEILFESLSDRLNLEMFEENSLIKLKEKIKEDLGLGKYSFSLVDNVVDVEVIGDGYSFDKYREVRVSLVKQDGTKRLISGDWIVMEGAPVYKRNNEVKETVKSLLLKYKNENLIEHLADKVLEKANRSYDGFSISSINDIKIILSNFSYGTFWDCKINIYLDDGSLQTVDNTYIYSSGKVTISENELKSIGGERDVEF